MKIMKGYRKGTYTLANSMFDEVEFHYEDYVEECEENGIDPEPEDSDAYDDWCRDAAYENYQADMDNIAYCKEYNVPVAVTGTLELWWGHPFIKAERFDSVYEAIQECMGKDTVEVKVEWSDGVIYVEAYHHDGCNCFIIKALSKKGERKVGSDYKPHDFKQLPYLYAIY